MRKKTYKFSLATCLLLACFNSFSQEDNSSTLLQLTLEDAIKIAHEQSPDALLAKNQLINKYWQYRTFKADFLPNLSFDGTLPDLNRSIIPVIQPNGTSAFVYQSQATSNAGLSINQKIGYTGTEVFVRSQLNRLDIFADSNYYTYSSTPVYIGIVQPILSFNRYRWQQKIEPMLYEEARREYDEAMEGVAVTSVENFFELYLAKINLNIALINQANNDTLYKIAQGRYNLGKIAEDQLLQMELGLLNSNTSVAQSKLDIQTRSFELKRFLGYKENVQIELIIPDEIPDFQVDYVLALYYAKTNRRKMVEMERQMVEARKEVARAKGENGFNANITAGYKLTQSAPELENVYANPQDGQNLTIGIQIPIIDWGKTKAQVRMAKARFDFIKTSVEQEAMSFEQEIYLNVMQFNIQRNQLLIAAKADTIGMKRYEVAKQRYLIGKIEITDLNIALNEKDVARRGHVEAMKSYWRNFYGIRKLTMYDFKNNKPISYGVSGIK